MDLLPIYILVMITMCCLTAVKCFKIKYGDSKDINDLKQQVAALNDKLAKVNAEAVIDLQKEVQVLRNYYGLKARKL